MRDIWIVELPDDRRAFHCKAEAIAYADGFINDGKITESDFKVYSIPFGWREVLPNKSSSGA